MLTVMDMGSSSQKSFNSLVDATVAFGAAVMMLHEKPNITIIVTRHGWADKLMMYDSEERITFKHRT